MRTVDLGMVVCTFNPSTLVTEAGRSLSSRVPSQPELQVDL